MAADHQLLFGLLALQNGLIDQVQLVAAFQSWTRDKTRSLADYLVDRGDLDADDRAVVDALVTRHLKKHGGDAERSLASLSLGSTTRQRLKDLVDADLETSVGHVSHATEPGADTTATYSVGSATSDGQRFRVLRPHARGGLGAVFVALDGELNREVALKQILDQHADDPSSRHRFLIEAEVTGGLEHPGIVPVYGLGTYADGRPFYAMRFIRGDSLKEAIASFHADETLKQDPGRRSLELRKLLRRFLDVCNALEYAHARGVLHRDIKPGNIIVGKYGETLIVDWGLAKPTGKSDPTAVEHTLTPSSASGSAETLPGSAVGTPAYMSPEQARGDLGALGPRSDVYSLGATLYSLLTGRPPFEGDDLGEVLRRVQAGDFTQPRKLDPSIDASLESVCLKSMATRPEDRYASCRALAEDVDRWLADEPVTARREPLRERASRWLRKHPVMSSAAAATLVVGLAASLYSLRRERAFAADLKTANAALDTQKQRAEAREQLAIDAVKKFDDAVAENPELKNNPKLEQLRKTLLKEPLAFFRSLRERLQADGDSRPESLVRLAEAAHHYAHLTAEIGDKRDGLKTHDDSLAIWLDLTRASPSNSDFQSGLATIQCCRGDFLKDTGKPAEALAAYEQSRVIFERLARDNPTVTEYQRDLARGNNLIGLLLSDMGKPAEALAAYEQSRAIRERLARDNPTVAEYQSGLADSHNNIGLLLSDMGKPAEALAAYEQSRAIRERLARDNPTVAEYQSGLAKSHGNLGLLLSATGKPAEALAAHEQSRVIRERLARDNPSVTEYQRDLAKSHGNLGLLLSATGKPAEALAAYEQSRVIFERLAKEHVESPEFASALGGTLNNIATIDMDAKRFAEGREKLREAVAWQRKALAVDPGRPLFRQYMVTHLNNLIRAARGLGDEAAVAEVQHELVELQRSDPGLAALDIRLTAVLKGEHPRDNSERLALAQRAYGTQRFALAARLFAEALESDPELAADRRTQHPYNAACTAALAATGRGKDDPAPDDAAKTRLRRQALDWLKGELAAWEPFLQKGPDATRGIVAKILRHWQQDTDLAGVRDQEALAALPEPERKEWQALWGRVDELLRRAEGGGNAKPAP